MGGSNFVRSSSSQDWTSIMKAGLATEKRSAPGQSNELRARHVGSSCTTIGSCVRGAEGKGGVVYHLERWMWDKSDSSCDPSFGRSAPEVGTFHLEQRLPVLAGTPYSSSPAQCYQPLSSLTGLVDQGRRRVVMPSRNFKATIWWVCQPT